MREASGSGNATTVRDGEGVNTDQPFDSARTEPVENAGAGDSGSADGTGRMPILEAGDELTPEQMTVLTSLVNNPDVQAAAAAAGVNRATIYRWLKKPVFHEELKRQRNESFAAALATVKTHAAQAVAQLAGMLNASDERLRRSVCNDILGHGIKVHNLQDIHERLTVLEREAARRKRLPRQG